MAGRAIIFFVIEELVVEVTLYTDCCLDPAEIVFISLEVILIHFTFFLLLVDVSIDVDVGFTAI